MTTNGLWVSIASIANWNLVICQVIVTAQGHTKPTQTDLLSPLMWCKAFIPRLSMGVLWLLFLQGSTLRFVAADDPSKSSLFEIFFIFSHRIWRNWFGGIRSSILLTVYSLAFSFLSYFKPLAWRFTFVMCLFFSCRKYGQSYMDLLGRWTCPCAGERNECADL